MELIDLTIEESFPRGAYICSALIDGYRVHMTYMGYNKQEALQNFKESVTGSSITDPADEIDTDDDGVSSSEDWCSIHRAIRPCLHCYDESVNGK